MFKLILDEYESPDFEAMGKPTVDEILKNIKDSEVHEPGITNQYKVVIADWNDLEDWVYDYLEWHDYETSFDDVSDYCDVCYCHINLETYDEPIWVTHEYGRTCKDCVLENPDDYIEDYVFWSDSLPVYPKAVPSWLIPELEKNNLVPLYTVNSDCKDKFESGLYSGMNDTPDKVAANVTEELGSVEMLFCVDECTPFMITFSAYVRKKS